LAEPLAIEVGNLLAGRGWRLALAESCTGGLLSKIITDVPGSSGYFAGAVCAYANEAKVRMLGVSEKSLREHGAVSEAVAGEMAAGARERFAADYSVAVTGVAGPDGGTAGKPVGLVFIALASAGKLVVRRYEFAGSREAVRGQAAAAALALLRDTLISRAGDGGPVAETFEIGVLASGGGTDLQSILDACERGDIAGRVAVVITNNPGAGCLDRARRHGAAAVAIDHRGITREEHERQVVAELRRHGVKLVVLAGYLRMLTPYIVGEFKGRMINIHPALLPAFGGKGMHGINVHRAVLAAGSRESGCTVHFVDESIDGGPIIAQSKVPVRTGDTPEDLQARVLEEEHRLLPKVVGLIAKGKVKIEEGKVFLDGV
jgi:phosphoribosylglycinamide formyltransferase-1